MASKPNPASVAATRIDMADWPARRSSRCVIAAASFGGTDHAIRGASRSNSGMSIAWATALIRRS